MPVNLTVDLGGGLVLRNPVLTASGTFGFGKEYEGLVPLDRLGGITVKGVAPFASHGNPTPRTCEVFAGMLNSIGLQGPGLDKFIHGADYLPWLRKADTKVFVNIWGKTVEQYAEVAAALDIEREGIAGLEINISCPNIKEGGIAFGTDPVMAAEVVSAVREATTLPLITKLSPNVTRVGDFARIVVDAGSDMVSLINTFPALAIDIETRKPMIARGFGGLSGHGIKPLAVRMVYEAAQAVDVPVIGMGGIFTAEDAIEFIMAGASAIAVGTAIFADPQTPVRVVDGIEAFCERHGIASISELVGTVQMP